MEDSNSISSQSSVPQKRGRGRPRKADTASVSVDTIGSGEANDSGTQPAKRGRGRPPKSASAQSTSPGQLSEASADMLQQRTASNPRETAAIGDDVAYD